MDYNTTLFSSKSLQQAAKLYLKHLPEGVECILSRGMSGCAIGSAMVALSDRDLKHTVVRKPHENAHSGSYAGQWIPKGTKVAIVDDFISSGETIEEIVKYIQSNNLDLQAIIVWSIRSSYKTPKECELIVLEDEDD